MRNAYSACLAAPFTGIFENIGNFTPNFVVQKPSICASSPGSCAPKSFDGNPATTSPFAESSSCSFSSPSYCGVKPHSDATFTTSTTLPR